MKKCQHRINKLSWLCSQAGYPKIQHRVLHVYWIWRRLRSKLVVYSWVHNARLSNHIGPRDSMVGTDLGIQSMCMWKKVLDNWIISISVYKAGYCFAVHKCVIMCMYTYLYICIYIYIIHTYIKIYMHIHMCTLCTLTRSCTSTHMFCHYPLFRFLCLMFFYYDYH